MINSHKTKILYCNLNRSKAAHDMLDINAEELDIDVLCCSEPNQREVQNDDRWSTDEEYATGICSVRGYVAAGHGPGYVWREFGEVVIVSCYISPNVSMQKYENFLNGLKCCVYSAPGPEFLHYKPLERSVSELTSRSK